MTSKLTREQLEEWVTQFDEDGGCDATDRQLEALIRQSLAAMDSEPVAYMVRRHDEHEGTGTLIHAEYLQRYQDRGDYHYTPLYRHAQPVPVVPEALEHLRSIVADPRLLPRRKEWISGQQYSYVLLEEVEAIIDDACRAAMLQDGNLPDLKRLEDIKFNADCAISDPESIYASEFFLSLDEVFGEKGNYKEPVQAKAVSMLIAEVFRLRNHQTGNSPVVPDSSASMLRRWLAFGRGMQNAGSQLPHNLIAETESMLAAAPQPQNAPQNIPEIIPGWIPVSEQMPPSRHEVLVGRWWGEKPRWCCKWATYIPGHPDAQSSGWLLPGASWTPTHWMELPDAPQEAINALIPLVSRNEQEVK